MKIPTEKKQALISIAEKQYGYFIKAQTKEAGYKNFKSKECFSKNEIIDIERGLFRLSAFKDSLESNCTRWSLWSRNSNEQPQGIISRYCALALFGLIKKELTYPVEMTVPKGFRKRKPNESECVLYKENLPLSELKNWGVFLSTNMFRTLKDTKESLEAKGEWQEVARKAAEGGELTQEQLLHLGIINNSVPIKTITIYNAEAVSAIKTETKDEVYCRAQDAQKIFESMERQGRWAMSSSTFINRKSQQGGFTLVELMVVIAVISILAGMLLPTLENAMTAAKFISCSSNLRQTWFATSSYGNDYDDYIPFAYTSLDTQYCGYATVSTPAWFCLVGPYLGLEVYDHYRLGKSSSDGYADGCVLTCPNQEKIVNTKPVGYAPGIRIANTAPLNNNQKRGRFAWIKRPTEHTWLVEHVSYYYHNERHWIWGDSWGYMNVFERHNGININMLFFDGHVDTATPDDVYSDPYAYCFAISY